MPKENVSFILCVIMLFFCLCVAVRLLAGLRNNYLADFMEIGGEPRIYFLFAYKIVSVVDFHIIEESGLVSPECSSGSLCSWSAC